MALSQSIKNDLAFGIPKEEEVFDVLKIKYPKVKHYKDKSTYDFLLKKNYYGELKSRRNRKDAFPTTYLYKSKIQNIEEGKKYKFLFLFTDGLYYINYDKELFDTFKYKNVFRRDRMRYYMCIEIPVVYLKKYK